MSGVHPPLRTALWQGLHRWRHGPEEAEVGRAKGTRPLYLQTEPHKHTPLPLSLSLQPYSARIRLGCHFDVHASPSRSPSFLAFSPVQLSSIPLRATGGVFFVNFVSGLAKTFCWFVQRSLHSLIWMRVVARFDQRSSYGSCSSFRLFCCVTSTCTLRTRGCSWSVQFHVHLLAG